MAKEQKSRTPLPVGKYRQVDIASIQRGRRGKHHDLVLGIVQELATLEPGAALRFRWLTWAASVWRTFVLRCIVQPLPRVWRLRRLPMTGSSTCGRERLPNNCLTAFRNFRCKRRDGDTDFVRCTIGRQ